LVMTISVSLNQIEAGQVILCNVISL
jgi:hypothetical protein